MDRDELLVKVFDQLEDDIKNRDFTAIEELLRTVSDAALLGFLPEGDFNA
jgi:hypothetical protein